MASQHQEVRILSNNAYLVPWFFVLYERWKGDAFGIHTCRDQKPRARRLGLLAKEYDVLLLQELWGGCSSDFSWGLEATHAFLERNEVFHGLLGTGILADWGNAYNTNILNQNGGLFGGYRKNLSLVWQKHHNFVCNKMEEGLFKSVQFMLLDMKSKWPGKYLLTINTHLHSPLPFSNTEERRAQRAEMKELLIRLQTEENFPKNFSWKNCGVVMAGDFNTAYQTPDGSLTLEYVETVKKSFGVHLRDAFLETHPDSKVHTYDAQTNRYVSAKGDSSRMDYVFLLDSLPTKNKPQDVMKLKGRCDIFVTAKGQDISDHYPIVLSLSPSE